MQEVPEYRTIRGRERCQKSSASLLRVLRELTSQENGINQHYLHHFRRNYRKRQHQDWSQHKLLRKVLGELDIIHQRTADLVY